MRFIVVLLIVALGLVAGLPGPAAAESALGSATWSLELGTTLGTNSGYSFAVRRHSGENSAIRIGIEASLDDADGNGLRTNTGSTDETFTRRYDNSYHTFSIQWMRFAAMRENLTATFALGPVVQLNRSSYRNEFSVGDPSFAGYENSSRETSYGAEIGLGMEWFFTPRFSLGGQSGLRATIGSRTETEIDRSGAGATYTKSERNIDLDTKRIGTTGTRFQVTGYF